MGLFDMFKKKNSTGVTKTETIDFSTPPCYSSEWFNIGEYYFRFQMSKEYINIKLRWEDYGTGGRLGWCDKEETQKMHRYMIISKDLFCERLIDIVISMQPYKTITEEQINARKQELLSCFEDNVKPVFAQIVKADEDTILLEIYDIVSKFNTKFPQNKIRFDNIFIGECVSKPNCIGCFYKEDGWYLYLVDDRFNLLRNGPFSLNGIIVALLHMLHIPAELQNRKFNNEEYKLYLSGEKPV